jgi:dinuclear metal center YbgI/SA1388 family protein
MEGRRMLVSELIRILDELAPFCLAEPWDNCGLLVGDESAPVVRVLVALELTEAVLREAIDGRYDTILTHHPVLFAPVRRVVQSDAQARLLRDAIRAGVNLIACHTNLDSAPGGIAEIVAEAVGLNGMVPLQMASAGWYKFVGFVPQGVLPQVSQAVFAAGAGVIGEYDDCAYATGGEGWFKPGPKAKPTVGEASKAERVAEVRWETVVRRGQLDGAIRAFVDAHPYEEPAFDVYPLEDRLLRAGLGRVGDLDSAMTVDALATRAAAAFGIAEPLIGGDVGRSVRRVAVLPGSGGSLLSEAAGVADAFITGDLSYHDSDRALGLGLALVVLPHGELEWGAMSRWGDVLAGRLASSGVTISQTQAWNAPWKRVGSLAAGRPTPSKCTPKTAAAAAPSRSVARRVEAPPVPGKVRLWIDGGSRGNPGPSAIGVVLKTEGGETLEEFRRTIGTGTNNVAEYTAMLEGLDLASRHGAREVEILSDSELLVKQMRGEYRVKNEGLRELFAEAKLRTSTFERVRFSHVCREDNARADALVNEALDEGAGKKRSPKPRAGAQGAGTPGLF